MTASFHAARSSDTGNAIRPGLSSAPDSTQYLAERADRSMVGTTARNRAFKFKMGQTTLPTWWKSVFKRA